MHKINLKVFSPLSRSYPIVLGTNFLSEVSQWLPKKTTQIVIITDKNVKKSHSFLLVNKLKKKGYTVLLLAFTAGEKSKSLATKHQLEKKMLANHCNRESVILALGGGVVGDMAGFIAATYMRGIRYLQLPTTYLAMVDSSIGGKTGINVCEGKNLIGAFWHPSAVIIDLACLSTLPNKQFINGLIETFKMFLVWSQKDVNYFRKYLPQILARDALVLNKLITRSIKIKKAIVQQDPQELGLRKILNFGHTIGHALEKESRYTLLHGFAVGYGILVEAKISVELGILGEHDYQVIQKILGCLGIKLSVLKKYHVNKIIRATKLDKKTKNNIVNYIVLKSLGKVYLKQNKYAHAVPAKIVSRSFNRLMGINDDRK